MTSPSPALSFPCLFCGYTLAAPAICPECGRENTLYEQSCVAARLRRRGCSHTRWAARAFGLALLYALATLPFTQGDISLATRTLGLLLAAIMASLGLGALVALSTPRAHRLAAFLLWRDLLLILHLGWLSLPLGALFMLGAGVVALASGEVASSAISLAAPLSVVPWLGLCGGAARYWADLWRKGAIELGLPRPSGLHLVARTASILVLLGGMVVGFAGGAIMTLGATPLLQRLQGIWN